jgi:hypothetical protein
MGLIRGKGGFSRPDANGKLVKSMKDSFLDKSEVLVWSDGG